MSGIAAVSDPLPALLAFLLGKSSLTTLITGGADVDAAYASFARLYSRGLPSPPIEHLTIPNVLPPTVVLRNARLVGHPAGINIQSGSIELRVYHTSHANASALWYLVLNLLRTQTPYRSAGVSVEALNGHSGPFEDVEPNGGYLMSTGRVPLMVLG